ncbi:hypothetical protein VNO77_04353 [Canavalia gladiata]|uniref:Uncharacterized protein n=1 Tax=Canavalia gladiata TaxID=3824 RepID=A0AAN9N209_CANGL
MVAKLTGAINVFLDQSWRGYKQQLASSRLVNSWVCQHLSQPNKSPFGSACRSSSSSWISFGMSIASIASIASSSSVPMFPQPLGHQPPNSHLLQLRPLPPHSLRLESQRPDDSIVVVGLVCGSLSEIASATTTFPLDLVRRRMQLEGAASRARVWSI